MLPLFSLAFSAGQQAFMEACLLGFMPMRPAARKCEAQAWPFSWMLPSVARIFLRPS